MLSEKRQKTTTNNGEERFIPPSLSAQQLDCDAWLGLKQTQESYPSGNGDGFGYTFGNEAVGCVGDYFHHHHHHHLADCDSSILPRTAAFHPYSEEEQGGMGMGRLGKSLFTGLQWEELERQRIIQKCIMGGSPSPLGVVPPTPQFLLPLPLPLPLPMQNNVVQSSLVHNPPVFQCEANLRYAGSGSSSADPEPWRCKRTDGKKWRCSRDAAPEQKYCERHAHKSKPRSRSRKHVEISNISHNHHQQIQSPGLIPPLSKTTGAPVPSMPAFSYDQTRSMVPDSPWQQQVLMMTSSTWEVNRDNNSHNTDHQSKNVPFSCFPTALNNHPTYIIDNKQVLPQSKKPSTSSSLTLSISGGNPDRDNNPGRRMMVDSNDDYDGVLKVPQWMTMMNVNMNMNMNPVTVPGGPLGEALCLGNTAKATRGGWNSASPQHQRR